MVIDILENDIIEKYPNVLQILLCDHPLEKTSDAPIYHLFMDIAYQLSEKAVLVTPGRFLFNAGKTPKSWNEKILNDEHIKVISFDEKSSDVFPSVGFKGV